MKLAFPQDGEDWSAAFNNGLAGGEFCNDPASHNFWAHFELQASETEEGVVVADWFHQRNTLEYKRIKREEIES